MSYTHRSALSSSAGPPSISSYRHRRFFYIHKEDTINERIERIRSCCGGIVANGINKATGAYHHQSWAVERITIVLHLEEINTTQLIDLANAVIHPTSTSTTAAAAAAAAGSSTTSASPSSTTPKIHLELKFSWRTEDGWAGENRKVLVLLQTWNRLGWRDRVEKLRWDGNSRGGGDTLQSTLQQFLQQHASTLKTLEYDGNDDFRHLSHQPVARNNNSVASCPSSSRLKPLKIQTLEIAGNRVQSLFEPVVCVTENHVDQFQSLLCKNLKSLHIQSATPRALAKLATLLHQATHLESLEISITSNKPGPDINTTVMLMQPQQHSQHHQQQEDHNRILDQLQHAAIPLLASTRQLSQLYSLSIAHERATRMNKEENNRLFEELGATVRALPNLQRLGYKSVLTPAVLMALKQHVLPTTTATTVAGRPSTASLTVVPSPAIRSLTLNRSMAWFGEGSEDSELKESLWREFFRHQDTLEELYLAGTWRNAETSLATIFAALGKTKNLKALYLPPLVQLSSESMEKLVTALQHESCRIHKMRVVRQRQFRVVNANQTNHSNTGASASGSVVGRTTSSTGDAQRLQIQRRQQQQLRSIDYYLGMNALKSSSFLSKAPLVLYPTVFCKLIGIRSSSHQRGLGVAFQILREQCGLLIQSATPRTNKKKRPVSSLIWGELSTRTSSLPFVRPDLSRFDPYHPFSDAAKKRKLG